MDRGQAAECQPEAPAPDAPAAPPSAQRLSRRRLVLAATPLVLVLVVSAAVFASGAWRHLSLDELRERRHELLAFVHAHPVLAVEIYIAAYALLVAFSLPGALLMSLSGGYLFGVGAGAAAAVAGASTGAVAMFLAARTALGDALARRFSRSEGVFGKLQAAARGRHAVSTLLALRLMPAVPFALVNILAGVAKMRLRPYVLATVAGIAPSTLIYAWTGHGLHAIFQRSGAVDGRALIRPEVYGPVVALAFLALVPLAWRLREGRAPARA